MLWARSTLVIFAVTFDGIRLLRLRSRRCSTREHDLHRRLGRRLESVFAVLIFSVSVAVSMLMLLDRSTDAITAALTSLRLRGAAAG
ncbi:MAG: hypothetical protein U1F25_18685 [Rubrivivax sp.]